MTKQRPELYVIREPETAERKVLHLSAIRPHHGPASPVVGRPWPRQVAWRERLRLAKSEAPGNSGKTD